MRIIKALKVNDWCVVNAQNVVMINSSGDNVSIKSANSTAGL